MTGTVLLPKFSFEKGLFSPVKELNIQMALNSHRFLCQKDSEIFSIKLESIICEFPKKSAHLLF